ncbi:MAG: outer membrane beta-barrel domain-containing protein, partial [Bdellovibrionota bacterium]
MRRPKLFLIITQLLLSLASGDARAAEALAPQNPEKMDVEALKQQYWKNGNPPSDLRVVQNKLFPKGRQFEIFLQGTAVLTDPFLSVYALSGGIGYNFNEFFQIHAFVMKDFPMASDALIALQKLSTTTNSNPPGGFAGGGLEYTPIYGKLSLFGAAIAHYDLHLDAGCGVTQTANGYFVTPYLGIGQVFYFLKWLALRVDYRMMYYRETIIERVDP